MPLLIFDDLGAETSTAWAEEKLYQIVVHRHEARLPTVITSAFSIDELEEAKPRIGSRLMDMNVVNWQPITAPNYRDQRRTRRPNRSGGAPDGLGPSKSPRPPHLDPTHFLGFPVPSPLMGEG